MTHDPLCPLIVDDVQGPIDVYECPCDLIAKVRENERDSAVKRIKSLSWSHENWIAFDERAAILAAIKAGQP